MSYQQCEKKLHNDAKTLLTCQTSKSTGTTAEQHYHALSLIYQRCSYESAESNNCSSDTSMRVDRQLLYTETCSSSKTLHSYSVRS